MSEKSNYKINNVKINLLKFIKLPYNAMSGVPFFDFYKNLFLTIPLYLFSIYLLYLAYLNPINIDTYGPTLLMMELTIAIFAINFSFLGYQFSTYRYLLQGVSIRQIIDTISVLLLSLSPLLVLIINKDYTASATLITIPFVAYASILLTMAFKYETNPANILKERISDSSVNSFIINYNKSIELHLKELKKMELVKSEDMYLHEALDFKIAPPKTLRDPLNLLLSLGITSIDNYDISTFEDVIKRFLDISILIAQFNLDYKVRSVVSDHFEYLFTYVLNYAKKKEELFTTKFLEVCEFFLRKKASEWVEGFNGTNELFQMLLFVSIIMGNLSKELLEQGYRDSAMITVIIIRQMAQKGVYYMKENKNDLFEIYIPHFPKLIKELGLKAIDIKNSEFLYRCIQSLGWLGCSAVKTNNLIVGKYCLQGLIKLGRGSRLNNLECFYTNCALSPFDHAREGIDWMASWIHTLEDSEQEEWVKIVSKSYSRLYGKIINIKIHKTKKECEVLFETEEKPHIETYMVGNQIIDYDYSDMALIKEMEL